MIRKNTKANNQSSPQRGHSNTNSNPNNQRDNKDLSLAKGPVVQQPYMSGKIDGLVQSFGRMEATLNSLSDKSACQKFNRQQSQLINQSLNGFQSQANRIQTKLDKPILILKSIQTNVLGKINVMISPSTKNCEYENRIESLENRLRKLESMIR